MGAAVSADHAGDAVTPMPMVHTISPIHVKIFIWYLLMFFLPSPFAASPLPEQTAEK
jgi:hypothetical protein